MMLIQRLHPPSERFDAELMLPFDLRQKTRLLARLRSGEEVGIFLERGTILRDGDCLQAEDGRIVRVIAAHEDVMQASCADPLLLARAAYHLGNRHVAVQVGPGWLRFPSDRVLAQMLAGLGIEVTEMCAPFEPEPGAYGSGHHHHAGEPRQGAIIHQYGARKES